MSTHSGRTPLVKHVPEMFDQLEQMLGGAEIGRIVVIDSEGNSVPFLWALEHGSPSRAWLTRMKPSWLANKMVFDHTPWQPYRDGDRIRAGRVNLQGPEKREFRIRVVEIERRTKGTSTLLAASSVLRSQDWKPAELAALYFDRWPVQEANFRALNQAVDFKQVHGYGKQLVDNVTVVTKLDELSHQIDKLEAKSKGHHEALETHCETLTGVSPFSEVVCAPN